MGIEPTTDILVPVHRTLESSFAGHRRRDDTLAILNYKDQVLNYFVVAVVVMSTVTVTESTKTLSAATVAVESVVVVVDLVVDGLLQEANATTAKIAMNFFIFDFGFKFIC